jgi:hypothetical protein
MAGDDCVDVPAPDGWRDQRISPSLASIASNAPACVIANRRSLMPDGVATPAAKTGATSIGDGIETAGNASVFPVAVEYPFSNVFVPLCCGSMPNCSQSVAHADAADINIADAAT